MRFLNLFLTLACLTLALSSSALAQRRTGPTKPAAPETAPNNSPTLDSLLASDTYKIYGEVRGVGQLIRSNSVNELLEPVMKLAGPPREFRTVVKWLNAHADSVITSRMLIAAWPTVKNVPDTLLAIEFANPEEAAKFAPQLDEFLPKVMPAAATDDKNTPAKEKRPTPNYYVKQAGSLLVITATPVTMKNLRPAGSKLLTEDANFRVARDRFSSESIFIYVDYKAIEKEEENSRLQAIEEEKKREAEAAKTKASVTTTVSEEPPTPVAAPSPALSPAVESSPEVQTTDAPRPVTIDAGSQNTVVEQKESAEMSSAVFGIMGSLFNGSSKWADGIGFGLGIENDSFDLRVLFINSPGETAAVIPFVPLLIPGPAISPQSPSILPGDTEMSVALSLDLNQIYNALTRPQVVPTNGSVQREGPGPTGWLATIEKKMGVKIKDDLLPVLGNEVAFSIPVNKIVGTAPQPSPSPNPGDTKPSAVAATPIIALSLRDREGMKALLPKIIDGLGFKGASALAQTQKSGDTELVSFADALTYAFIGDFLVLSTDSNAVHHLVDSYLKQETLSSNVLFKNYTRWQPRQLQGQVYVSPSLMENYKAWASEPNSLISDSTREFLLRLTVAPEPVTYSLSNEGFGPLHEVHLPKNLVLMAVAGLAGETSPTPAIANERRVIGALHTISWAEREYKAKNADSYASLEQLLASNFVPSGTMSTDGYKVEVIATGTTYQVNAVPTEYGTTGRLSYFIDQSGVLRSGDHGGAPATVSDRPVQ